jgi:hypothetical protein
MLLTMVTVDQEDQDVSKEELSLLREANVLILTLILVHTLKDKTQDLPCTESQAVVKKKNLLKIRRPGICLAFLFPTQL